MSNQSGNKRIVSYELLRMLAMYMVVLVHYNSHSGVLMYPGDPMTPAGIMAGAMEAFAISCLNTYGLITGYFMCEAGYRIRRIVNLWLQVVSYTVGIPVALVILGVPVKGQEGLWQLAKYVLPVSMEHYWFVTVYCLLYLLMPIMNKAVHSLTRRQLKVVIIALLIPTCVIKTLSPVQLLTDQYGYDLLWFGILYLIGAYIRLYDIPRLNHPFKAAGAYVGCSLVLFVLHVGLHAYNLATGRLSFYAGVPFHHNYIFTLMASLGLFYLFKFVHIREGRLSAFVRTVSPCVFGVYLIHEHLDIRDRWVQGFGVILGWPIATNPVLYLLQALLYVTVLYAICVVIEMVRKALFQAVGKHLKGCRVDRWIDEVDALFKHD